MGRLLILLALLPTVAHAEPTEVIHILNWNFVTQDQFEMDLGIELGDYSPSINVLGVYEPPATANTFTPIVRFPPKLSEIMLQDQRKKAAKYQAFVKDVEAVQEQQVTVLRALIKKHKLKGIYLEGLTEKNYNGTMKGIESIKKGEITKPKPVETGDDEFGKFDKDLLADFDIDLIGDEEFFNSVIADMNKRFLFKLGVAGQLVVKGELKTLFPAEDSKSFESANPIQPNGGILLNKKADEAREDAIVNNLMKANGVVVIILGGNHDLTDNIKRLAKGVRYKRVAVPKYEEIAE